MMLDRMAYALSFSQEFYDTSRTKTSVDNLSKIRKKFIITTGLVVSNGRFSCYLGSGFI